MGKGSKPRPYSVSSKEFSDNWDRIFGSKNGKDGQTDKIQPRDTVES